MSSLPLQTVFVGLDYHSESVQVCVLTRDGKMLANRSCSNDWRAVATAVREKCGPRTEVQAAIESCCGAADLADELIAQARWSVDLAHPGYVARIKQSPDKTDFSDARLLADLERVGYLPRVWLAPEEVRELRRLVRYRQTLAKERKKGAKEPEAANRRRPPRGPAEAAGESELLDEGLAGLADEPSPVEPELPAHHRPPPAASGGLGEGNPGGREVAGPADHPRLAGAEAADTARHRPRHGRDATGRDRTVRPLPHWQATGSLLRSEPAKCFQRPEASGCRTDQSRES